MQRTWYRKLWNSRERKQKLGVTICALGLLVTLSMLTIVPNPQDDAGAFDKSLQGFAGRGAIGIALLVAGQTLQKSTRGDVHTRLARIIASDRQRAAKPRVTWPDWPSNRAWVQPTLGKRPPRPHLASRAQRSETSL